MQAIAQQVSLQARPFVASRPTQGRRLVVVAQVQKPQAAAK